MSDAKESLREAATSNHSNCAWLDPFRFGASPCPVCEKPLLVPALLAVKIFLLGAAFAAPAAALVTFLIFAGPQSS